MDTKNYRTLISGTVGGIAGGLISYIFDVSAIQWQFWAIYIPFIAAYFVIMYRTIWR